MILTLELARKEIARKEIAREEIAQEVIECLRGDLNQSDEDYLRGFYPDERNWRKFNKLYIMDQTIAIYLPKAAVGSISKTPSSRDEPRVFYVKGEGYLPKFDYLVGLVENGVGATLNSSVAITWPVDFVLQRNGRSNSRVPYADGSNKPASGVFFKLTNAS
ncbi:MAG: hypothetical protein ACOX3T_05325 [Bdellovibrionota bacterium]